MNYSKKLLLIILPFSTLAVSMEKTTRQPVLKPALKKQTIFEHFGMNNISVTKIKDVKMIIGSHILDEKQWWYLDKTFSHDTAIQSVCFNREETLLATGTRGHTAEIFNRDTHKKIASFPHTGWVRSVCFDPETKLLATGSSDCKVRIFTMKDKTEIACFSHNDKVNSISFDSTGKLIATGSDDCTARIFDIENKKEVFCYQHQDEVKSVHFHPSKQILAVAVGNITRIFNMENIQEITYFDIKEDADSACFDPSGIFLATRAFNYKARIFNVETHKEVASIAHDYNVYSVSFDASGHYIATQSSDKKIRIFNRDTQKEVASIAHQFCMFAMCYGPSTNILATGSGGDDKVRIFAMHSDWTLEQLLLKKALRLWLLIEKPDKSITSIQSLLSNVAFKCGIKEKQLNHIWQTFPTTMQSALWRSIRNKIKQYGKDTDNKCFIS